jgi:phytoene dehydrogenase-like protein
MNKQKIIIIGAGLGGLSTGIYALINGFDSVIFEKNPVPGGLAACWKRKDYLIDGGIHFLTGHKPGLDLYRVFEEVGVHKAEYVDLDTYARYIDERSGITIDISSDLDKFQKDLLILFPDDHRIIKKFIKSTRGITKTDISEFGFKEPMELMSIWDWIKEFWHNRKALKYFIGKSMKPVSEYVKKIKNPILKDLFLYMFLPSVPVAFLYMVLGFVAQNQMGLLAKGSIDFARKMEERYLELGGKIEYKTQVADILVENDKAVGIKLEDGNIHNSDFVISAIDGRTVIYNMLDGAYTSEKINKVYSEWKTVEPFVSVSLGIDREFKDEVWMTLFKTIDTVTVAEEEKEVVMIRFFNYSPHFAPKGKTVIQVDFETEWEYWFVLRDDKKEYNRVKKELAQNTIEWLEKRYPGIKDKVEVIDVATPYTYWRYTLNEGGSYMGFLPTSDAFRTNVEKRLPGLSNFYMSGQWSMSMGGVQPVIYSGKHVIQLLCHDENREFVSTNE